MRAKFSKFSEGQFGLYLWTYMVNLGLLFLVHFIVLIAYLFSSTDSITVVVGDPLHTVGEVQLPPRAWRELWLDAPEVRFPANCHQN